MPNQDDIRVSNCHQRLQSGQEDKDEILFVNLYGINKIIMNVEQSSFSGLVGIKEMIELFSMFICILKHFGATTVLENV